jgi:pumilio family protein 6
VLRLVQLTDDTVSIHKNLLNEILQADDDKKKGKTKDESPLLEIALSETASKLIFMLLITDPETRQKCFDPYEHSVLFPNPTVLEDGQDVPTSRKDPELRRKELIKYLREPLLELCTKHTEELLRSRAGSVVLREVYAAYHPTDLVQATIKVCISALDDPQDKKEKLSLFEDPKAHVAIKNLIIADASSEDAPFASAFYSALKGRLMDVASSNRGAFVVAALIKVPVVQKVVVAELLSHAKEIKQEAGGKGATAGFTALLKEISTK